MTPWSGELLGTMVLIVLGASVCAGVSLKKSDAADSGGGSLLFLRYGWF